MDNAAATDPSPLSLGEDSRSTMNYLKSSLLSRLLESNPSLSFNTDHVSSYIQERLPHLFPSINIPSHLPYALMIENAIKGLGERNGSTEGAISDFIKEEYNDLPLAHTRILHVQLKMLCENGELVCKEGGRYVFVADDVDVCVGGMSDEDGKGAELKGGNKGKRGGNKNSDGKEKKRVSGLHDAMTDDEPSKAVVASIQEQEEAEENTLISEMVEVQGQSEKGMSGDANGTKGKCSKKRKRRKKKYNDGKRERRGRMKRGYGVEKDNELQEAGVEEQRQVSELPDARADKPGRVLEECIQEQVEEEEILLLENAEEHKQEILSQIQQGSILHSETICSSQQPLPPSISEGFSKDISAGIEHDDNPSSGDPEQKPFKCPKRMPCKPELVAYQSNRLLQAVDQVQQCGQGRGRGKGRGRVRGQQRPTKLSHDKDRCEEQLQQGDREAEAQAESERGKSQVSQIQDSTMHLETICSSQQTMPNFQLDSQKPLLVPMLEGLPKGIPSAGIEQDENPLSVDPEKKTPKRPRGRPCKSLVTPYQRRKLLKTQDQAQHCGQGRGSGSSRGRGRPPKLIHDTDQCKEQLQQEDRAQQHGRGRGRGRCRWKAVKLDQNANQYEEFLQQEDPAQQHGSGKDRASGKGRGKPHELDQNANQSEEQLPPQDEAPSLLELVPHVEQTCENLSMENALNSLSDANQTLQLLRPEPQNEDLGQDMPPPNLILEANQGDQLQQPQELEDQHNCWGKPPIINQD